MEAKRAIALGQLFDIPLGYPAMTLGERPVQGFLLTFTDPAVSIILDELEGYNPHRTAQENEYDKQQIEIYDLEGESLGLAWVYLMTSKQVQSLGGVLIPSGWWSREVKFLHRGYR